MRVALVFVALGCGLVGCVDDPSAPADLQNADLEVVADGGDLAVTLDGDVLDQLSNDAEPFLATEENDGLTGGYITSLVVASNLNELWATSPVDVYTSTNAAVTWTRQAPPPLVSGETITASALSSTDLFVGTSSGNVFSRGTASGSTWTLRTNPTAGTPFASTIRSMAHDGTYLYAATATELFRLGSSWISFLDGASENRDFLQLFAAKHANLLYTRSGPGVYRTATDAAAWELFHSQLHLTGSFAGSTTAFYVALGTSPNIKVIDGTKQVATCPTLASVRSVGVTETGGVIALGPDGYVAAANCYATEWTPVSSDDTSSITSWVATSANLYGFGVRGVFRRDLAVASVPTAVHDGLFAQNVVRFDGPASDASILYLSTGHGLYRRTASRWDKLTFGTRAYESASGVFFGADAAHLIVRLYDNPFRDLLVSTDGTNFMPSPQRGNFSALLWDPVRDHWLACKDGELFSSLDDGLTWTSFMTNLPLPTICKNVVRSRTSDQIYMVTMVNNVWRSSDGGATFKAMASGQVPAQQIFQILPDPANFPDVFVVMGSLGIFRVKDGDVIPVFDPTWTVNAMAIDPMNPSVLYAVGANGTTAMSVDGGAHWTESLDPKLQGALPTTIFVHPADRTQRWIGTELRGAFRSVATSLP